MKIFYRIAHHKTGQGLWYDSKGKFTGLIHGEYNFCANSELPMPFDDAIVGYLSATDTLEDLYYWFTEQDIVKLEAFGFFITLYQAEKYKFHNNHWLICQSSSTVLDRISMACS